MEAEMWAYIDRSETKDFLIGPYRCPLCSRYIMLDREGLEDTSGVATCPYCIHDLREDWYGDLALAGWIKEEPTTNLLEGPYQCIYCDMYIMLDSIFLNNVQDYVECPYCHRVLQVPEEVEEGVCRCLEH